MNYVYEKTYCGYDSLKLITNQKVKVVIVFVHFAPSVVSINDTEFDANDDTLYGIFVGVGEKLMSIRDIVYDAEMCVEEIANENESNDIDEENMRKELSSPYWTGRV